MTVYEDEEVLYDRSVEASLVGSGLDRDILVEVPVKGQTPKAEGKLNEAAAEMLHLAQDFVSSPSILKYRQIQENSLTVRNQASDELRENVRNRINGDSFPDSPVRKFGKGLMGSKYPSRDEAEAKEDLRSSDEAQKWRELGEKLNSGEMDKDTFDEVVDTLERNPEKKVTDFAV
jgi:hypothetical protein